MNNKSKRSYKEQMIEYLDHWLEHLNRFPFDCRKGIVRAIMSKAESMDDTKWIKEHDAHIRSEAFDLIEDIICDLEGCHIDHTENECGEWETFTVDYDKWADVFIKLRKLKGTK